MTDRELLELLVKKIDNIEQDNKALKQELQGVNTRLDKMDTRLDNIESEVQHNTAIIEGEIDSNIRIIADGHMAIDDKLNKALSNIADAKVDREFFAIRINHLEREINDLKRKIG